MTTAHWLLKSKPYEVQSRTLSLASGRKGFGYWLEMGLGKTQTALAEFSWYVHEMEVDTLIVVCPNALISTWLDEAERYMNVPYDSYVRPTALPPRRTPVICVYNYEAVIAKAGEAIPGILNSRDCMLVLDESIQIKNPKAKRTKKMLSMAHMAKYVRVLSGAPIVQGPQDAWAQLKMIGAKVHPSFYAFRNRYCKMGGYMNKQVVGSLRPEELNNLMHDNGFRALKSEWTDLPEQLPANTLSYEMLPEQKKHYKQMERDFLVQVEDELVTVQMVITQLNKLQQIASGFIINEDGKAVNIIPVEKNPKLKLIDEIVEEVNGKLIIFCYYRHSVTMLKAWFPNSVSIQGGMTSDEIKETVNLFNGDDGTRYCIAQIAAAKYGFTLLGTERQPCHTSIYFENSYSLDARIQAEGRNHRHGQRYPVTSIDVIGSGIEKKAVKALQEKRNVASAIVDKLQAA